MSSRSRRCFVFIRYDDILCHTFRFKNIVCHVGIQDLTSWTVLMQMKSTREEGRVRFVEDFIAYSFAGKFQCDPKFQGHAREKGNNSINKLMSQRIMYFKFVWDREEDKANDDGSSSKDGVKRQRKRVIKGSHSFLIFYLSSHIIKNFYLSSHKITICEFSLTLYFKYEFLLCMEQFLYDIRSM
ncbi:hypothetical protein M8C21_012205 [Ambrosia artemisiifolia]|uniref:Uncharacterized protein n=1 Tax=Ambrosia artemisiifolia TaxID=4212 RepID=A0AAD5CV37_AMBAR|nr:hypothetical protein M8C21_012205 [Ambrosia artemisiifolia]